MSEQRPPEPAQPPRRTAMERPAPVTIEVDGCPVPAHPGESLATALLAAGQRAVGTTRGGARRGPYCNMGICFECVVTVDDVPCQRSCLLRVRAGMRVRTAVPR
ncbi:(2Fe-2S)-binding protein [Micromonospora sp. NPDC049051]|uniref:(2Fe-2S)-binding protein n=1 Tax=unclassified Micromonospora TaxID=2617518 RepID=UPI00371EA082